MPNYEPYLGYLPLPGSTQASISQISGIEYPSEETYVDPDLPVVSTIYLDGGRVEYVVIPKHRFVGMKKSGVLDALGAGNATNRANTAGDRPIITTASGADTGADPMGAAFFDLYKGFQNRPDQMESTFFRQQYMRFPFLNWEAGVTNQGYNSNLNGALYEGAPIAPDSNGRPVLFIPRKTSTHFVKLDGSGEGTIVIADYKSASTPYSVSIFNVTDGEAVSTDDYEVAFSASTGMTITFDSALNDDIVAASVTYGHASNKLCGQVLRFAIGKDMTSLAGWLRRPAVPQNFPNSMMANHMYVQDITAVMTLETDGVVAVVDSSNSNAALGNATVTYDTQSTVKMVEIALPFKYIDPTRHLKVEYAAGGSTYVELTNASLERQIPDVTFGPSFAISPASGTLVLFLSELIALQKDTSKVRVTCSIELGQPRQTLGMLGNNGMGIEGLTDGSITPSSNIKLAAALHPDGAKLLVENGASTAFVESSGLMNILVY